MWGEVETAAQGVWVGKRKWKAAGRGRVGHIKEGTAPGKRHRRRRRKKQKAKERRAVGTDAHSWRGTETPTRKEGVRRTATMMTGRGLQGGVFSDGGKETAQQQQQFIAPFRIGHLALRNDGTNHTHAHNHCVHTADWHLDFLCVFSQSCARREVGWTKTKTKRDGTRARSIPDEATRSRRSLFGKELREERQRERGCARSKILQKVEGVMK